MFKFKVNPDGGEQFEVEATSRDIARWEAARKGRSIGALIEDLKMSELVDLAWFAADRRGETDLDIAEFRAGVDIDFEKKTDADEDSESDPT